MRGTYKPTKNTGQKCVNLSETHFKEIILELENAAEIILNQKDEIKALESALVNTKDEIEILQENDRVNKKEKKKLIMENQKALSQLNNEIETLKMELQHSKNQVEVWKNRTHESKASLRKFLESTIMDSGNESINNCKYTENYENTIVNLKNQLDERQLRIEQLEMNIQNINIEKNNISNELICLKNKNKSNEYELKELKEKQRKDENEKKRHIMREEKLSQEIDSLCKKYNAEIDLLQKKNTELNEEIWELNRTLKNKKNIIKELEDQNINSKKHDHYFFIKKIEHFVSNKIAGFESSIKTHLSVLNSIVQKLEKNKIFKRNIDIEKNIDLSPDLDCESKSNLNQYFYNLNDENINTNTTFSGITTVNSNFSSNNNSNAPIIVQPSIEFTINDREKLDIQDEIDVPPDCTDLLRETTKALDKASYEHKDMMQRIQSLLRRVNELENKEEKSIQSFVSKNEKNFNSSIKDDDSCSESSVISFLSEI